MRGIARVALEKKWQGLIREQQESKLSVSAFRRHGFSGQSFYNWRKRLAEAGQTEPVRFALVEANPAETDRHAPLELILTSSDFLRIAPGADEHHATNFDQRVQCHLLDPLADSIPI